MSLFCSYLLYVNGDQKYEYRSVILKLLRDIIGTKKGIKEMIPCNCPKCKDSENPNFYDYKTLSDFRQNGREVITCSSSIKDVSIGKLLEGIERSEISKEEILQILREIKDRSNNEKGDSEEGVKETLEMILYFCDKYRVGLLTYAARIIMDGLEYDQWLTHRGITNRLRISSASFSIDDGEPPYYRALQDLCNSQFVRKKQYGTRDKHKYKPTQKGLILKKILKRHKEGITAKGNIKVKKKRTKYLKKKRMGGMAEEPKKCPECGSADSMRYHKHGELVCEKCGYVMEENIFFGVK